MRLLVALAALALAVFALSPVARGDVDAALARAEVPLNGPWAFAFGDDPARAAAAFDDRDWERVDLTPPPGAHDGDVGLPGYVPGWTARGHAGRAGHAWYRLRVRWSVPPGTTPVLVGPTLVDGAHELYWNGRRIGGIGDFAALPPRVYATRPQLYELGETASSGDGVLAIHVYLPQELAGDAEAGGLHVAPILAERTAGAARHVAQWWQTFWGYVVDLVEPLALLALALFALSLRRFAAGDRFLLPAAAAVSTIALSRLNQPLYYWSDVESLRTIVVARYVVLNPLAIVLWVVACHRVSGGTDRRFDAAACVCGLAAGLAAWPGGESEIVQSAARSALLALCGWAMWRAAACGARPLWLTLATSVAVAVALFAAELSAIGVPGIWFPYGVGVSRTQYALAVAIPLLGWLLHRRVAPGQATHLHGP